MSFRFVSAAAFAVFLAAFLLWAGAASSNAATDNVARIRAGDLLYIQSDSTLPGNPIGGVFKVEPSGKVPLGPVYGRVEVSGLTPEEAEDRVREHLAKTIKNPHVLLTWYDPIAHGSRDLAERVQRLEKQLKNLQANRPAPDR